MKNESKSIRVIIYGEADSEGIQKGIEEYLLGKDISLVKTQYIPNVLYSETTLKTITNLVKHPRETIFIFGINKYDDLTHAVVKNIKHLIENEKAFQYINGLWKQEDTNKMMDAFLKSSEVPA